MFNLLKIHSMGCCTRLQWSVNLRILRYKPAHTLTSARVLLRWCCWLPIVPYEFQNTVPPYMARRSTLSRRARIFELRSEASLEVRETAITALETPQARPC